MLGNKQPLTGLVANHEKITQEYVLELAKDAEKTEKAPGSMTDLTALDQMAKLPNSQGTRPEDMQKRVEKVAIMLRAQRGRMGRS